jgi:hypothetical protein
MFEARSCPDVCAELKLANASYSAGKSFSWKTDAYWLFEACGPDLQQLQVVTAEAAIHRICGRHGIAFKKDAESYRARTA